jgi:elongation factor P
MKATIIRKGNILRIDGVLYRVLVMDHVTPGKGRAHIQTKLRNIIEGTQNEIRFRSDEDVERISFETKEMQFLYNDQEGFHFMDTSSYDQVALSDEQMAETQPYLVPDMVIQMQWFEDKPVSIELPPTVDLTVVETPPSVKDATASAQRKPAKMDTGLVVQVPAFIEEGEKLRINTAEGTYSERVKS